MKATSDAVKEVIRAQGLDTLTAEDMGTGDKVGFCEGSAADLCAHVDFLMGALLLPFRVRLSKGTVDRKRGARTAAEKPFVFVLEPQRPQPVNEARPAQPAQAVPLDFARDAGAASARAQYLDEQVKRLQAELDAMRAATDEDPDEDEDEDEGDTVNAAPRPWWESEAFGKWVVETMTPIGRALGNGLAMKFAPPPMKPTNGAAPAAPPSPTESGALPEADEDERRILAALRNWRKADPETSAHYLRTLTDNFAATDEQQS